MRVLLIDPNTVRAGELAKADALAAQGLRLTVLGPRRFSEGGQRLATRRPVSSAYRLVLGPVAGKAPNRCLFLGGLRQAHIPRPDVVLVLADENFLFGLQALWATRRLAPGALFVCHSWQNLAFGPGRHPQPSPLLYWLDRRLERPVLAASAAIICRNRAAGAVLRAKGYPGPLPHIPWGVDLARFRPSAGPRPAGAPLTIGYAGRLVPEKGVDLLLAASGLMARPHRLRVAGSGPEEPRLRRLAQRLAAPVEFTGPVEHEAMPAWLAGLDVLVLSSRTTTGWAEQFGRVLVEALACGVLAVGSDSGSIPEVLGDRRLLFPEGDAAALAGRLDGLADPGRRAALLAPAMARARARFGWDAWAADTALLLRSLRAGQPPGPPLEML